MRVILSHAAASLLLPLIIPVTAAVHEALDSLPAGWTQAGAPAGDQTMALQIGLQQQNLDKFESMLFDVSTPSSASYGKYLEAEDVASMLKPASEANDAVLAWLKDAGVTDAYSDGFYVNFSTSVDTANSLLDTEFKYYKSDGLVKLRTLGYSLPDDLVDHVDLVTPTTYFGKTSPQIPAPRVHTQTRSIEPRQLNASCAKLITPACIKELYNINYVPDPKSGSKIAFGSFLNESARRADLAAFESKFSIPSQGFSVQLINGGVDDQAIDGNHGEANLDVEYIIGTSHPLPVISYITGGSP